MNTLKNCKPTGLVSGILQMFERTKVYMLHSLLILYTSQRDPRSYEVTIKAQKLLRLQRDSNLWPPRYQCDALPTELWSLAGSRSGTSSIYTHYMKRTTWCVYDKQFEKIIIKFCMPVLVPYILIMHVLKLVSVQDWTHESYCFVLYCWHNWKGKQKERLAEDKVVCSYILS